MVVPNFLSLIAYIVHIVIINVLINIFRIDCAIAPSVGHINVENRMVFAVHFEDGHLHGSKSGNIRNAYDVHTIPTLSKHFRFIYAHYDL